METYTVVKRIAKSKEDWKLTKGSLYAVETDEMYVNKEDWFITVWNEEGKLAEMYDGEYEVVAVDRQAWLKVRPKSLFVDVV